MRGTAVILTARYSPSLQYQGTPLWHAWDRGHPGRPGWVALPGRSGWPRSHARLSRALPI